MSHGAFVKRCGSCFDTKCFRESKIRYDLVRVLDRGKDSTCISYVPLL
jgi:hypothetical protein